MTTTTAIYLQMKVFFHIALPNSRLFSLHSERNDRDEHDQNNDTEDDSKSEEVDARRARWPSVRDEAAEWDDRAVGQVDVDSQLQ